MARTLRRKGLAGAVAPVCVAGLGFQAASTSPGCQQSTARASTAVVVLPEHHGLRSISGTRPPVLQAVAGEVQVVHELRHRLLPFGGVRVQRAFCSTTSSQSGQVRAQVAHGHARSLRVSAGLRRRVTCRP